MEKLKIFGSKEYESYIGYNSIKELNNILKTYKYNEIFIIHDSNVKIDFVNELNNIEKIMSVEVLETIKSVNNLNEILNFFITNNVKKETTLILNIGGGVLSDLVGFACSIFKRGVDVAFIPTTLVSMVDASIGSKNGIDYNNNKNYLGTFYDPKFVLIDPNFLKTLPKKEFNSGIAEIIKISYLLNTRILKLLQEKDIDLEKIIYLSILEKNEILKKDLYDKKDRKILNFGHTYGHAIESYYNFEKYSHGEAVALGMCLAYPNRELIKLLQKFNLPVSLEKNINITKLFEFMKKDKKIKKNNEIFVITLEQIEKPKFIILKSEKDILKQMEKIDKIIYEN